MKTYKYLGLITILYVTFQLISDVTAGKIVQLGIFTVSATALYFPITYIFSDILTEVYGYSVARRTLWKVLLCSLIGIVVYQVVVWLPPAVGFEANDAYARVLGNVPRIVIAGFIAVWAGSISNDYVLAKMKVWTKGKYLWTRTIGSTVVGEFVNTLIFYIVGLYGIIPTELIVASVLSGWFLKVAVEVIFTPVTYYVVNKLKKLENEDYYDIKTNFNPFIIRGDKSGS